MNDEVPFEITEAAYDWLDLLSDDQVNDEIRTRFVDWIHQSPVHVAEFLRASALHAELRASLSEDQPWLEDLLKEDELGVLQMPTTSEEPEIRETAQLRSPLMGSWVAMAASLLLAVSMIIWMFTYDDSTRITTVVGEMRILVLEDGSRLELNTDSEVRVGFDSNARRVELIRGELLINVVKDPARPFVVSIDDVDVTAIGTQFNIYRKSDATEITVIEGRVMVDWFVERDVDRQLELDAGQQAIVAENTPEKIQRPPDVNSVKAWVERRLTFDDTPVAEVAAEFNRYNRSRVLVSDPALANRRITAVFDVNDPSAFIALLQGLEEIDVQMTGEGHRRIRVRDTQNQN